MERIVYKHVYNHLANNNLIYALFQLEGYLLCCKDLLNIIRRGFAIFSGEINNIDRNNEPNSEDNVFEELDVPFTEPELENDVNTVRKRLDALNDNLHNVEDSATTLPQKAMK
jgi:hypothetical protein